MKYIKPLWHMLRTTSYDLFINILSVSIMTVTLKLARNSFTRKVKDDHITEIVIILWVGTFSSTSFIDKYIKTRIYVLFFISYFLKKKKNARCTYWHKIWTWLEHFYFNITKVFNLVMLIKNEQLKIKSIICLY